MAATLENWNIALFKLNAIKTHGPLNCKDLYYDKIMAMKFK